MGWGDFVVHFQCTLRVGCGYANAGWSDLRGQGGCSLSVIGRSTDPESIMKRAIAFSIVLLSFVSGLVAQSDGIFKRKEIERRMISVAKWQLANPKHELYDWTNGAFYAGVFAAYETTKSKEIWDALLAMGEKNNWGPGKRFDHADDIVINQTYLDMYRISKDKKMLQPTIDVVAKIKADGAKGREVERNGIREFVLVTDLSELENTTIRAVRVVDLAELVRDRFGGVASITRFAT